MNVTVTNHFIECDIDFEPLKIEEDNYSFKLIFQNKTCKEFRKSIFSYTVK